MKFLTFAVLTLCTSNLAALDFPNLEVRHPHCVVK